MRKLNRNINYRIFLKSIGIIGFVFFISFWFAFAKSEGADGLIYDIMGKVCAALAFPLSWLLFDVFHFKDTLFLFAGLMIDIFIYSFLVERIFFYVKRRST
jgi:hypothetical protein